jgi:hypothetical protein
VVPDRARHVALLTLRDLCSSSSHGTEQQAQAYADGLVGVVQCKWEPLSIEEADRLLAAAKPPEERLCVWGLLETGLTLAELASLNRDQIRW